MLFGEQDIIQPPVILTREEYPREFLEVPETIGDAEACSLLWYLPAFQIRHIPAKPSVLLKHQIIAKEFTGMNTCALAVRLNMGYEQVKKVYNESQEKELTVDLYKNIYIAKVAERCGGIVAYKLLVSFPGRALHIPRKGKNLMVRKLINIEFNGANQIDLAVKYNLSIACVYRFLKKQPLKEVVDRKNNDDSFVSDGIKCRQLSLF